MDKQKTPYICISCRKKFESTAELLKHDKRVHHKIILIVKNLKN